MERDSKITRLTGYYVFKIELSLIQQEEITVPARPSVLLLVSVDLILLLGHIPQPRGLTQTGIIIMQTPRLMDRATP